MPRTDFEKNIYKKLTKSDSISERFKLTREYLKYRISTVEKIIRDDIPNDDISEEEMIDLIVEMFTDLELSYEAIKSCYPAVEFYKQNFIK